MINTAAQAMHISPLISTDNIGQKFQQMVYFYGESDVFIPLFTIDENQPDNNILKVKIYRTADQHEDSVIYYSETNEDIVEQNGKLCLSLSESETNLWKPAVYTLHSWNKNRCRVMFLVWNY